MGVVVLLVPACMLANMWFLYITSGDEHNTTIGDDDDWGIRSKDPAMGMCEFM